MDAPAAEIGLGLEVDFQMDRHRHPPDTQIAEQMIPTA
jgi:hypothetical protein